MTLSTLLAALSMLCLGLWVGYKVGREVHHREVVRRRRELWRMERGRSTGA